MQEMSSLVDPKKNYINQAGREELEGPLGDKCPEPTF
jgi:hypothetical protein